MNDREEVHRLRDLLAALVARHHPSGVFVPADGIQARRGSELRVKDHPMREGYMVYVVRQSEGGE